MEEELEILQSIYFDDILNVKLDDDKPSLEVLIYPPSSENEENSNKTIILTLVVNFTKNYPNEIPKFSFKNVKGLPDEDIQDIRLRINEIANKNIGEQMLFEIIQDIKDFLTGYGNIPKACKCSICLSEFSEGDKVTHLDCYHYFHTSCLGTYLSYSMEDIEKEKKEAEFHKIKWEYRTVGCPECRQPMSDNQRDDLNKSYSDSTRKLNEDGPTITISSKMRHLQEKMKSLFERQKQAGGIIEIKEDTIIMLNRPNENETQNELEDQNLIL